jgi:hypothetical protein
MLRVRTPTLCIASVAISLCLAQTPAQTTKDLCINKRFTTAGQCAMVELWLARLVQRGVFGSVTRDCRLF